MKSPEEIDVSPLISVSFSNSILAPKTIKAYGFQIVSCDKNDNIHGLQIDINKILDLNNDDDSVFKTPFVNENYTSRRFDNFHRQNMAIPNYFAWDKSATSCSHSGNKKKNNILDHGWISVYDQSYKSVKTASKLKNLKSEIELSMYNTLYHDILRIDKSGIISVSPDKKQFGTLVVPDFSTTFGTLVIPGYRLINTKKLHNSILISVSFKEPGVILTLQSLNEENLIDENSYPIYFSSTTLDTPKQSKSTAFLKQNQIESMCIPYSTNSTEEMKLLEAFSESRQLLNKNICLTNNWISEHSDQYRPIDKEVYSRGLNGLNSSSKCDSTICHENLDENTYTYCI